MNFANIVAALETALITALGVLVLVAGSLHLFTGVLEMIESERSRPQ